MENLQTAAATNWIASLRGFLGAPAGRQASCELCSTAIAAEHSHLLEPESRELLCACDACSLLFDTSVARRYRRVPRRSSRLEDFALTDAEWDAFLIPISIAFFYRSSPLGRVVAMYPGPAGSTESTLDLAAWDDLATKNPVLDELQEDVEALLVNRIQGAREYYRVPIDRCFELVGLIRSQWTGLAGGDGPREAIRTFFATLARDTAA